MTDELMRSFHISARELGNLSGFYFYAYVAMQIPTGVLVDSWGARKLLIWGSISAAAGTFLFASTGNFALACLGRAIIGGATAVGWVVLLKLATHWFPGRKFAMLSGLGLFFGNMGALVAQVPLRLLISHFGWRPVVLGSAAVILGIGLLALSFVKNDPSDSGFQSYAHETLQRKDQPKFLQLLAGFSKIFAYRNTWLIFFSQGAMVGAVLTFTGLWGIPISEGTIRVAIHYSRLCLLRDDRLLGRGKPALRSAFRQDRAQKAGPFGRMLYRHNRMGRAFLSEGPSPGSLYCSGGYHKPGVRSGRGRFRVHEGIRSDALSRNDLGSYEHWKYDWPDALAARHRVGAGQRMVRCACKRRTIL